MKKIIIVVPVVLVTTFGLGSVRALASAGPQPTPLEFHIPPPRDVPYSDGTLQLHVDVTNVAQRIYDVHEVIPVSPGDVTLLYPEWVPGYHGPANGPIDRIAGLIVYANGTHLAWIRDPANVYAFHVKVPQGVSKLNVNFQYLASRKRVSPEILDLAWNKVVLYPAGYFARDIQVQAAITLPEGFKFATALSFAHRNGNDVTFNPTDFENLVDSPLAAGKYYLRINLKPGANAPVYLDLFADAPRYLKVKQDAIQGYRNVVEQMYDMYGSHHYDHYDFLVWASDKLGEKTIEHHRSSEDGVSPDYFTHWKRNWTWHRQLVHEYNHSWDGKYRRPTGLWTPNFNMPKRDYGLWVYEGFTRYCGYVISARAGLWSKEQALQMLALAGATYDRGRPGMKWRNILDTTNDPIISLRPQPYRNYQLRADYYTGGMLIWLAVDAKIRDLTHDRRDLNNFARDFFGVHNGAWDINTYTFNDIVGALNKVAPYDWKSFLDERLTGHGNLSKALDAEGWKLVYNDKPSTAIETFEKKPFGTVDFKYSTDLTYSIGIMGVNPEGSIRSVLWNGPAFKAGMAPGMVIKAVNGKAFTFDALKEAVTAAKTHNAPIKLLVKNFNEFSTITIDYHGGLQYPHLERIKGAPDYLSQVLMPLKHMLAPLR